MWFLNNKAENDLFLESDDRIWDVLFNGVSLIDDTTEELDFIFHNTESEMNIEDSNVARRLK